MSDKVKKKITIFIVIGLLIILTLTGSLVCFLINKDNAKKGIYLYDVNIENNIIKVYSDKLVYNDKNVGYSQKNVDKFIDFISDNYIVKNNSLTINHANLNEYQAGVILCLVNDLEEAEFEVAIEEYKYSIYLNADSGYYIIYLKDDDKIHVKKVKRSSDGLDITKIEKSFDINFSKDNSLQLVKYLNNLFIGEDSSRQIYKNGYRKDEELYIKSIIYNDESYLNKKNVKLLYTMSYTGVNCLTPTLYLYSDNTYEYYYTFAMDSDEIIPKTGSYNVNIKELLKDAIDDVDTLPMFYTLADVQNGKSYYFNMTSIWVKELLNQTNASLSSCLVQQGYNG